MKSAVTRLTPWTLAALVAIAACSSSTSHPPITTGGATGGGGGGTGDTAEGGATLLDAGGSTDDAGNCINGTFEADVDTGLGGANQIAGDVLFSTAVQAGHTIVLTVTALGNATLTYAATVTFPTTKDSVAFRLRGLPDATYTLQAQADVTGNVNITQAGNLDGYFGGTTLAPIHARADGTSIIVPPCKPGIEFGIGPK